MSQYCPHEASCRCDIYVPKSGDYFVRMGNERPTKTLKSLTENLWTIFLFWKRKWKKKKKPKNWFRKLIRNLRAFKDCDCIRLVPVRKNSWRQELLHSRTAGAERVNVLPSLSLCVVCLLVCLFVNLPQLKPSGSLSVGWEGSVCSYFPTPVPPGNTYRRSGTRQAGICTPTLRMSILEFVTSWRLL